MGVSYGLLWDVSLKYQVLQDVEILAEPWARPNILHALRTIIWSSVPTCNSQRSLHGIRITRPTIVHIAVVH